MNASNLPRQSRLHGILGYDVFISYTRRDGRQYAHELASRLIREHDFVVFLDDRELEVGQHLAMLLRQVRRSRMLVLLASPEVSKSKYVPQEVAAAYKRRRRIVPIDLEQTIAQGRQGAAIGEILSDEKRETEKNGLMQGPSDSIVLAIVQATRGMRRRVQQRLLVGAVMTALLALTVTSVQFAITRAVALDRETVQAQQGRSLAYSARVLLARELSIREPTRARKLLEDERLVTPELRDLTWRLVHQETNRTLWQSPVAWGPVELPGFLHDGRLLTVGVDGIVRIVDLDTGSVISSFQVGADAKVVAIYNAPGSRLCTLEDGGLLTVYSAADGTLVRRIEAEASHAEVSPESRQGYRVSGAVFLAQGDVLATTASNGARFWDLRTGQEILERRFLVPKRNEDGSEDYVIAAVRNQRNSSELLLGLTRHHGDNYVSAHLKRLRDVSTQQSGTVRTAHGAETKYLASSESGLVALLSSSVDADAASPDGFLTVNLMGGDARRSTISAGQGVVTGMTVGQTGAHVILAYDDGVLRMLDTNEGTVSLEISSDDGPVSRLEFDEERERLAMVTTDGQVRVISTTRLRPSVSTFRGHWSATRSAFHVIHRLRDHRMVHLWSDLDIGAASSMELLDSVTGVPDYEEAKWLFWGLPEISYLGEDGQPAGGARRVLTLLGRSPSRITPDSEWLAALDHSELQLQDLPRALGGARFPRRMEPTKVNFENVLLIDFAEDPDRYALIRATKQDDEIRSQVKNIAMHEEWTLAVGRLGAPRSEAVLWEGKARPQALAYSPDGQWLAFADGTGPIRLWNALTNEPVRTTAGSRVAMRVDFAPDDANKLLVLSEDAERGVSLQVIVPGERRSKSLELGVRAAAIVRSAGPGRVVAGAEDGTVVVVDWERQMVHSVPGPDKSFVFGLEVSEDAKTLLVSRLLDTGTVRCTLADATFGHDIMELSAGPIGILGAGLLSGDAGVVMIGADQRYHVWKVNQSQRL